MACCTCQPQYSSAAALLHKISWEDLLAPVSDHAWSINTGTKLQLQASALVSTHQSKSHCVLSTPEYHSTFFLVTMSPHGHSDIQPDPPEPPDPPNLLSSHLDIEPASFPNGGNQL
jgi:hypothetical protein